MTFVLLHTDRLQSVGTTEALVPAAQVDTVRDAAALLVEAGRLRDAAEQDIAVARSAAHADGMEKGREQGRLASEAATTEAVARLEAAAAAREIQRRGDVARLAIEVVRRIAGDLGDAVVVAGLAQKAAASLVSDAGAVVRVAPGATDEVRRRLAGRVGLNVEEDPALSGFDCVLETSLGRTHAGLETQLAAIERAWGTV